MHTKTVYVSYLLYICVYLCWLRGQKAGNRLKNCSQNIRAWKSIKSISTCMLSNSWKRKTGFCTTWLINKYHQISIHANCGLKSTKTFDPVDWSKLFEKLFDFRLFIGFVFNFICEKKLSLIECVFKMEFLIEVFNWLQYHVTNVTLNVVENCITFRISEAQAY